MSRPFFSIVVPTRNRHETLPYALKTILQQDFEDYEIIVSDNSDPDNDLSQKAVADLASDKIRYFRTPKPLAMHDNWEYALEQTTGEYLIVIGDDDGLLPYTCSVLHKLLTQKGFDIIKWRRIVYTWPGTQPNGFNNKIQIPTQEKAEIVQMKDLLQQAKNVAISFAAFPKLYDAVIHSKYMEEVKKRSGRYFSSIIPDAYSGFCMGFLAKEFLTVGRPMTINGASAKSNGGSFLRKSFSDTINQDFKSLQASSEINCHSHVPYVRSMAITYDGYIQASERLLSNGELPAHQVNRKALMQQTLDTLSIIDQTEWNIFEAELRRAVHDSPDLTKWLEQQLKSYQPKIAIPEQPGIYTSAKGFSQDSILLAGEDFDVSDVFGASLLAAKVIGNIPETALFPSSDQPLSPYRRLRTAARILIKGR